MLSARVASAAAGPIARRWRSRRRWPRRTRCSPSMISVVPASTDSAVAPAGPHRLDRRDADDRHVEPHVLIRLRHLDDARRPARRFRRRAQIIVVGAFHRLDGHDRLVLDHDRLADVERRDGVRHAVAERDVLQLFRRWATRWSARRPAPAAAPGTRSNRAARCPRPAARRRRPRSARPCCATCSRVRTDSSVRSGTMPEKILACLTCPAITACGTPAAFRILIHLPEWPSDTQWRSARASRAARSSSGNASSFTATTVTSWPRPRAPWSDEERETGRCRRRGQSCSCERCWRLHWAGNRTNPLDSAARQKLHRQPIMMKTLSLSD